MAKVLLLSLASTSAFLQPATVMRARRAPVVRMDDIPMTRAASGVSLANRPPFTCSFEIPKKGIAEYGTCNMNFKPILVDSELVMVTYDLPFGLSAEPKGRVVAVTKDGEGGEKVGDILRFTLQWQGGQPQPAMFDVYAARPVWCAAMERRLDTSFDEVVRALVSNDGTWAEQIVLIFERPLEGANVAAVEGAVV